MGLAKDFNKVLQDEIRIQAAWLPITNTFAVGDFGVISDGVFTRMGNITSDFNVAFTAKPGAGTNLNFTSKNVRVLRFEGGAAVNAFAGDAIDAKLRIEFGKERSFFLRAALTSSEMEGIFRAAQDLAAKPRWNAGKFKVVSAVYTGGNCTILSSRDSNAAVEISAKADALKKLDMGGAEAGLSFSSKSGMGLEILGQSGTVGLTLFKVEQDGPKFEAVGAAEKLPYSLSTEWSSELPDDL
jgi:hypothetical protein